jgi:hypothetical protein
MVPGKTGSSSSTPEHTRPQWSHVRSASPRTSRRYAQRRQATRPGRHAAAITGAGACGSGLCRQVRPRPAKNPSSSSSRPSRTQPAISSVRPTRSLPPPALAINPSTRYASPAAAAAWSSTSTGAIPRSHRDISAKRGSVIKRSTIRVSALTLRPLLWPAGCGRRGPWSGRRRGRAWLSVSSLVGRLPRGSRRGDVRYAILGRHRTASRGAVDLIARLSPWRSSRRACWSSIATGRPRRSAGWPRPRSGRP